MDIETQIAQAYSNALEQFVGAKNTDPQAKDKTIMMWGIACDLYETKVFAEEGELAAFIDLCEAEIAQW